MRKSLISCYLVCFQSQTSDEMFYHVFGKCDSIIDVIEDPFFKETLDRGYTWSACPLTRKLAFDYTDFATYSEVEKIANNL